MNIDYSSKNDSTTLNEEEILSIDINVSDVNSETINNNGQDSNISNNLDAEVKNLDNSDSIEPVAVKKKRGRKPKNKEEVPVEENKEKVLKKRGRKPKIKTEEEVQKIPKKRGRKPKEKIYSVKELPKTFYEENKNETLIIHLPINLDNIEKKYPLPNEDNKNYSEIDKKDSSSINNLLPKQINFLENDDKLIDRNNFEEINNDNFNDKEISKNNDIENIVEERIENLKNTKIDKEIKNNKVIKKNLRNILYEFINSNNEKVWPEKTNIHCWWCCHKFNNTPCSLPYYYKKEKFYVKGVFCSFNCAASYNFSINDDDMYERYSLLNLMYKKLYNKNFVKINLSPPRESLKIFGGYLSIEEFRENSLENNKLFNLICPPLISIVPKIEETINYNKNGGNSNSNINENILNKTQNILKLKRNKPVTNPNNTLQSFMDLKII